MGSGKGVKSKGFTSSNWLSISGGGLALENVWAVVQIGAKQKNGA